LPEGAPSKISDQPGPLAISLAIGANEGFNQAPGGQEKAPEKIRGFAIQRTTIISHPSFINY
jgi:hypothetical protein